MLLPRMVGGARVLERLGEGGMAVVHRAEDPFRPDRQLAVKFLRSEAGSDPELVRRFLREGEVLKGLQHPHLVEVYDYGKAGTMPFLLMELLPGGSVKACRGEAPARILRRFLPVIDALDLAHTAGVIHRDLKPSNLLFASDGRLKVTDFGVCLWEGGEGTRVTKSQMVVGTVGYMAPEQHGDPRRVDARCDVYALGAILYEFTTGQPYSQVQLPPASVRPGFPPGLAGILMRTLAADPQRRVPSMSALSAELGGWLETAAAAGWGEEPLPGFRREDLDQPTLTRARGPEDESPEVRLGPYLDALATGGVGSRRAAAERLLASVGAGDEAFLLEQLAVAPEGARFALVQALGLIGTPAALPPILRLLQDPFARAEAAEAASLIAQRTDSGEPTLVELREAGLGSPWRWMARARLGDGTWAKALLDSWGGLSAPHRIQALEAAKLLPEGFRQEVKVGTAEAQRAGGNLRQAWEAL
jgi:hypothetical protein